MASKTRKPKTVSPTPGEIQVNFGNVEALKLQLMNQENKSLLAIKDLLVKIDASLIRMEGKYDANQETANG